MSRSTSTRRWNLEPIIDEAVSRLPELLDSLSLSFKETDRFFVGCCPVHDGDNKTAVNIFKTGDTARGNWICYTHNCHRRISQGGWGSSLFDFVRGTLTTRNGHNHSFVDGVKYVVKTLAIKPEKQDDVSFANYNKKAYAKLLNNLILDSTPETIEEIKRSLIRKQLHIPSQYFLNRGYTKDILDKYDVGDCNNPTKPMYKRAVVPVYNSEGIYVGCLGRSVYPECSICNFYHHPDGMCGECEKWKVQSGFNDKQFLFNLNNASKYILESGNVILVEGPGDVMRLEEAGIHNSVALFGVKISDSQELLLEKSGAERIVLLLDNDQAGENGANIIHDKLKKLYQINIVKPIGHDVGSMDIKCILQQSFF